jgi:hypothetical protein
MLGAGVVVLWCEQQRQLRWVPWLGCLALLVAGALALRWWRSQVPGELYWDGDQWHAGPNLSGRVAVRLDLQRYLLLQLTGSAPASKHWLWLERDADHALWLDVRRAVYSRASGPSPPAGLSA